MSKSNSLYRRVSAFICGCVAAASGAAAEPYRYDDIRFGASFVRLEHDLDLRDIHAAIAAQQENQAPKRKGGGERANECR